MHKVLEVFNATWKVNVSASQELSGISVINATPITLDLVSLGVLLVNVILREALETRRIATTALETVLVRRMLKESAVRSKYDTTLFIYNYNLTLFLC